MKARLTMTAMVGLAALALAGCGSKDNDGKPKSLDEVKQEAAKLVRPLPGQYKQVTEIQSLEMPGVPKEVAEQMRSAVKKSQEGTFCLTKADADKGFKDMFNDVGKGNQCSYSRFDVDGGKLDAQMECQTPQQGNQPRQKAVMKMSGTLTEQGSDVTVDMDTAGGPPPMGTMKMKMHMTTTRLGDCKTG